MMRTHQTTLILMAMLIWKGTVTKKSRKIKFGKIRRRRIQTRRITRRRRIRMRMWMMAKKLG
jgi:hypothetical protein